MGDRVRIEVKGEGAFEGILLPSESDFVILKLDTGYNLAIDAKKIVGKPKVLSAEKKKLPKPIIPIVQKNDLPHISILHTGGTIASKVDYETGGVVARFTPEELLVMFPELHEIANVSSRLIRNMASEDIRFAHYNLLAKEIEKEVKAGVKGVIITHGTDTLHYTAAALAFALENLPIPVILVGAQRSSDRPSSDAAMNVICAAEFIAKADFSPTVALCMHESTNDSSCIILPAIRSRKNHTSRRDAFQPIDDAPLARIDFLTRKITPLQMVSTKSIKSGPFGLKLFKETLKVGLLKVHTNMFAEEFLAYQKFDGLLVEGLGMAGNIPINEIDSLTKEHTKIFKALAKLITEGVVVACASQTVQGRINMNVYSTGRRMQQIGLLGNGTDMTPETAFIKLAWCLSNVKHKEIAVVYAANLRGENRSRDIISPDKGDFSASGDL